MTPTAHVRLPAELDVQSTAEVRRAFLDAVQSGARSVVVDVSEVRFTDCAGWHAVVRAVRDTEAAGLEVALLPPAAAARLRERSAPPLETAG